MIQVSKNSKILGWILFSCLIPLTSFAQIELSGFVDFRYQQAKNEVSSFTIGPFELDFEWQNSENVAFEGAVVVEDEAVSLGQTMVDLPLIGKDIGVQMGLLDMPFGIDYELFATPDRFFTIPPLTTELLMDGGWGDVGINLYGSYKNLNFNFFLVNGMGVEDTNVVNQIYDNNHDKTPGGKLELVLAQNTSLGVSFASGKCNEDGCSDVWQRGVVHLKSEIAGFQIRSEYYIGKDEVYGEKSDLNGGYFQAIHKLTEKSVIGLRYGKVSMPDGKTDRIYLVGGYQPAEGVIIKTGFFTSSGWADEKSQGIQLQTVLTF